MDTDRGGVPFENVGPERPQLETGDSVWGNFWPIHKRVSGESLVRNLDEGLAQHLAVDLARKTHWNITKRHKERWNHVAWEDIVQ